MTDTPAPERQHDDESRDERQRSGHDAGQVETPWAKETDEVSSALETDLEQGLSADDARSRLDTYGRNEIRRKKKTSWFQILINQLKNAVVLILAAAAVVSLGFGKIPEAIAIFVVVVINTVIGFITELRATRSMEALRQMSKTEARVRRDGDEDMIEAPTLVPGDIVVLEEGDVIPADLRVIESAKMEVDESALTGESVPVTKQPEPVEEDAPLAERASMLYKGTALTRGTGEGVVVATGMNTELGHIAEQVEEAEEDEKTPLEDRIDSLGKSFIWLTTALSATIILVGWLMDKDLLLMVESAVALAVAAIPEGLPIVATIALARGMRRMAARNAIINRLSAVETLGGASIIGVDKTGTLTENKMTVTRIALADGRVDISGRGYDLDGEFTREDESIDPDEHQALKNALIVGALCANAGIEVEGDEADPVGDPMEVALIVAAHKAGLKREELLEDRPEEREVAFDREVKMMATYHKTDDGYLLAVKGAPEAVLEACSSVATAEGEDDLGDDAREQWKEHSLEMAGDGLRVLALAHRKADSADEDDPYHDLTLLGMAGLLDPPREDVKDAINASQAAGVRVVMATGDQAATARSIAYSVGLTEDEDAEAVEGGELGDPDELDDEKKKRIVDTNILARVSPAQKLAMIDLHQQKGHVVAMTGDGVNDAPALTKADIGVAMGQRGTQVAKDASDMILKDDAFSTIVTAIEQGRVIFNNIRKFVLFLLTVSLTMIVVVFTGSLLPKGMPLPLMPLQVLFLNAVTNVFPALALGVGEGSSAVMKRPPLSADEPIVARHHWVFIVVHSILIAAAGMGAYFYARNGMGFEGNKVITVSFIAVTFAQLLHVFNVRDARAGVFVNDVTRNGWVWLAIAVSVVLLAVVIYVKPLADVMKLEHPGMNGWLVGVGGGVVFLILTQLLRPVFGRHEKKHDQFSEEGAETAEKAGDEDRTTDSSPDEASADEEEKRRSSSSDSGSGDGGESRDSDKPGR